MSNPEIPSDWREFRCIHCDGMIQIPKDLAPTSGPCPHCQGVITSPAPVVEISVPDTAWKVPTPLAAVPPIAVPAQLETSVSPPPVPTPVTPQETPAIQPSIPPKKNPASAKDDAPPKLEPPKKPTPEKSEPRKKSGLLPVMLVLLVLILAAGAAMYYTIQEKDRIVPPPSLPANSADSSMADAQYVRIGWQKEAYQVLRDFIAATSSKEKLPFVLNSDALSSQIEDFYGGAMINDSDTPADAFSIHELTLAERKRGLFLMIYDQPPQFDIKEFFRPLASAEVQAGIDEAGLLLNSVAGAENFTMEPLRVHAYFKRTPAGLKLDWEVFVQTKYRTLQRFIDLPEIGQIGLFRVFVVEDVPDKNQMEVGTRTYRVFDTANPIDFARVNVKVDSEAGRALSVINWRDTKDSQPTTRTATLELKWAGEETAPELEISRFICWEFLGLGGQEIAAGKSAK